MCVAVAAGEGEAARATPEALREPRELDNSDSDADDVLAALTTFNDNDATVFISLNAVRLPNQNYYHDSVIFCYGVLDNYNF